YFMTIAEAARLALSAASLARGGETFVLEMGDPVSIDALARRMIEQSGRAVEIRYTGLRPGEKLTEELCLPDERVLSADGRRLRVSVGPPVDSAWLLRTFSALTALAAQNDGEAIRTLLHGLFPGIPLRPPE
ncbi:MAG: polysaccharide biosynthesis protein, partial [Oscillospiraceae bacterium]